jgi:hypothetical protein
MARYLAALEADQRQAFILGADKLKEMRGASAVIKLTVDIAKQEAKRGTVPVEPVKEASGAVWLASDDLASLAEVLWTIRTRFAEELGLSSTFSIVEQTNGFNAAVAELEHRNRQQKDAKTGEEGAPAGPYFAQCGIQPYLPANAWRVDEREPRRRLLSRQSAQRLSDKRLEIDSFVENQNDSYIAFIRGDADGMGGLLATLDWEAIAQQRGERPEQISLEFSQALNAAMEEAAEAAKTSPGDERIECIVLAGDDVWLVAERQAALPAAARLSIEFGKLANEKLGKVLGRDPKLSLTLGILFAKKGFPFDAQFRLAGELLDAAKRARRQNQSGEGWIHYFWLESSGRESIEAALSEGMGVRDGSRTFQLFTRPWTAVQTQEMIRLAGSVRKVPRRKLQQLDQILRMGEGLSQLAFRKWKQGLTDEERTTFDQICAGLALTDGPWRDCGGLYQTPLLEIIELSEVLHEVRREDR